MAGKRPKKKVSKAEQKSARRIALTQGPADLVQPVVPAAPTAKKPIDLPATIVIRDLAATTGLPLGKIMGELLKSGITGTLNDSIDFDTAAIILDELGFEARRESEAEPERSEQVTDELIALEPRPPVVTIMGHVDHGKTSLLDAIRRTNVVASESGGITQHIGAYQVVTKNRPITFLDTPGHEAFAALRAHGANLTDIVILVVASTEGVRPQTLEALSHARAANVPVIVALTKVDLPDANLDKVKRELADHELIPEEWGGKTIMVPVSAKTSQNLEQLLEMVLLVADLGDLKAPIAKPAQGTVIEAHLEPGLGPVATVLVQEGTLHTGDIVILGNGFARVRIMHDWTGQILTEATPSVPAQIAGLKAVPKFGDRFRVVPDERTARQLLQVQSPHRRTLPSLSGAKDSEAKELPIVLKVDVPGSRAAIEGSLEKLGGGEVSVTLVHVGIGPVSDSDINLAAAASATIFAFRVPTIVTAKRLADYMHVEVKSYDVIYQLIDELTAALTGLLEPEKVEVELGKLTVLKIFSARGAETIVGGRVTSGQIDRHAKVKVYRGTDLLGEGKITSLQREKQSATSVKEGFECGLGIEGKLTIEAGDELRAFRTEERTRTLSS